MTEGVTCCGRLERFISNGYVVPFEFSQRFAIEGCSHTIKRWIVHLHRRAKAGGIIREGCDWAYLDFCPFCGKCIGPGANKVDSPSPAEKRPRRKGLDEFPCYHGCHDEGSKCSVGCRDRVDTGEWRCVVLPVYRANIAMYAAIGRFTAERDTYKGRGGRL